jgi:hypothetical protein
MTSVHKVLGYTLGISAVLIAVIHLERLGVESAFMVTIFRHLVLYQDYYAFLPYIAILFLALLPQVRKLGSGAASWCGKHPWWAAIITSTACAAGARYLYQAHPLSLDEYTVLFQSKIFAAGRLTGQFPPEIMDWLIPKAIQGKFLKPATETGEVAATYWPGFSLLLAPFTGLGIPWLLNPLIAGGTVLVMHKLGLALFGERESAGYVVLFTVASPAITINAISYYAMPAHMLANALYMLLLLSPSVQRAAFAGLVGSFALVLHNPIPHIFFALPWILWLALDRQRHKFLWALLAGYLPLCILIGFGWAMFLDRLKMVTEYGALPAPSGVFDTVLRRFQTILEWFDQPTLALHVLNFAKLWIWAVPALVTMALLGLWKLRRERGIWVLIAASGLATYIGYFYIPFDQGHGWGYRYFHSAWLVLPLFAVAAVRRTPGPAFATYLAGCAVLSLAMLTTFQGLQVKTFIARHLAQLPDLPGSRVRVVIVNPQSGYYSWDLVQNDPFLRQRVVFLLSRGASRDLAMMARVFPKYQLLSADQRASLWGEK